MDRHDQNQLLQRAIAGENDALNAFVEANQGLVYALVHRFGAGPQCAELFQVGCVGLMKAVRQFNPAYETAFSTYAVPLILGEIKRYFRDQGALHVSRTIKEGMQLVRKAQEELEQSQGSYTLQELSVHSGVAMEELICILEAGRSVASLQEEIYDSDGSTITLESRIPAKERCNPILSISLRQEIARLSPREQLIISERYEKGTRQEDVARMLSISQVQISRLEKQILLKLRKALG